MPRTLKVDERGIDAGHRNPDRLLSLRLSAVGFYDLSHDVVQEAFGFFV